MKEGRLTYCFNFYGVDLFHIESTERVRVGTHHVVMEFQYDGGGPAKGGMVTLFIDNRPVGEGRVERTQPLPFASDEPLEIGTDGGSPVTRDYSVHRFAGVVHWVDWAIALALASEAEVSGEKSIGQRIRRIASFRIVFVRTLRFELCVVVMPIAIATTEP
jgi:hypothetical protein